ncbi:hypothetical protein BJ742DRAFT_774451 [Cladochytrium replicatum]|nr:hypothetical protein BJ742DRAFT_774451 [Cladochytrium replicatum]
MCLKTKLEYARDSHGSIYFHDDFEAAKKSVSEALESYASLLESMPTPGEREEVNRRVGLKIAELKAQLEELENEEHDHGH